MYLDAGLVPACTLLDPKCLEVAGCCGHGDRGLPKRQTRVARGACR
jgi:hypothetical protein